MPKQNKQYRNLFYAVIISFLIGMSVGYVSNNEYILSFIDNKVKPPIKTTLDPILVGTGEINTCFTPPSGCGLVIANLISKAQEAIYVQAYSLPQVK
jgi:phospholipase D